MVRDLVCGYFDLQIVVCSCVSRLCTQLVAWGFFYVRVFGLQTRCHRKCGYAAVVVALWRPEGVNWTPSPLPTMQRSSTMKSLSEPVGPACARPHS